MHVHMNFVHVSGAMHSCTPHKSHYYLSVENDRTLVGLTSKIGLSTESMLDLNSISHVRSYVVYRLSAMHRSVIFAHTLRPFFNDIC